MITAILIAFVVGVVAALIGGGLSGLIIGKDALGAQLALYMGALYGFLAGGLAVVVTIAILYFI